MNNSSDGIARDISENGYCGYCGHKKTGLHPYPINGMIDFDDDLGCYMVYSNGQWYKVILEEVS